jgi:hypothetical protein
MNIDPLGLDGEGEFDMEADVQLDHALSAVGDPCANGACVLAPSDQATSVSPRTQSTASPRPGDDSICPGVCHDNPNLTSDEYRRNLGNASALTLGGALPYVGEAIDLTTLTDDESSLGEKGWAMAGLVLPVVTGKALGRVFSSSVGDVVSPSGYSVAFEMTLDPADIGRSRSVHFNRANAALDNALRADSEFAGMMDELIPGVADDVARAGGRQTPEGWTWHHTPAAHAEKQQGVMRLVPEAQHTSGSPFWDVLHPNGAGGYSEWAIPAGAPPN